MATKTPRAFINDHDTIVFEDDIEAREDGVTLDDFLAAGYREVTEDDRIVIQAAEADPRMAHVMQEVDADTFVASDVMNGDSQNIAYIQKVRALRRANDRMRKRDNPEPTVVKKGSGR